MNLSFSSRFFGYLLPLFIILFKKLQGASSFSIVVPSDYMVLQGELVVQVIFAERMTKQSPEDVAIDVKNIQESSRSIEAENNSNGQKNSIKYESPDYRQVERYKKSYHRNVFPDIGNNDDSLISFKKEKESLFNVLSTKDRQDYAVNNDALLNFHKLIASQKRPLGSGIINNFIDVNRTIPDYSSRPSTTSIRLFLSLHSANSKKTLKKLPVPIDGSQTVFSFPCGVITYGGLHVVRLKKGKKTVAESSWFNVTWPPMIVDIPIRLETYISPADIQFSFTKAHQCLSSKSKTFETWVELLYHGADESSPAPTRLPTSILRQRNISPSEVERSESSSSLPEVISQFQTVSKDLKGLKFSFFQSSITNRQRRFALTSLRGSVILSKSKTNLKSEAFKRWDRDESSGALVVQRVPINRLYTKGKHSVSFRCEVIGPAGKYSVRIITNITTNPVILQSGTFLVEWAETFKLNVPLTNLIPCMADVPVTFSQPVCAGNRDKIRLYAYLRANVTSANPPIYRQYVTERRANNHSLSFDCNLFTDEPTEYCFIYVNTATSGAVSDVLTQCVATFKPGVLRIDGQWGNWSSWSECTANCRTKARIKHRFRFCDSPPPRNGGLFCQGQSLESKSCGNHSCIPVYSLPSDVSPDIKTSNCLCGCSKTLNADHDFTITPSAEHCSRTSTWIIKSPPRTVVTAELVHCSLLGGSQWLKVRDGSDVSSPLILSLPSFRSLTSREKAPITSTESILLVSFRSDVNASFVSSVWGFTMKFKVFLPQPRRLEWSQIEEKIVSNFNAFHMTVIVMGVNVLIAITCYLAYYCKQYPVYKKSLLIIDDSPLETPEESPMHQRPRTRIASTASITTLTEVISLTSLKFGAKKNTPSSYIRLAHKGEQRRVMRSLPSSPMLPVKKFQFVRRSSSQLLRKLKKGNINRKKQNRRSASFDQLRTDISPIGENIPILSNSLTMDLPNKKTDCFNDPEDDKGEEHSEKYKEYRKSMLASKRIFETTNLDISKHSKNRINQKLLLVKLRKDGFSSLSSEGGGVRTSSSVSEISVASGVDLEMEYEYDYYDYDVGNASAAPGSLFGIDPTLQSWMIDIDDLDIKTPQQLASARSIDNYALISAPSLQNLKDEIIPMQMLKIDPDSSQQQSSSCNESNESSNATPRPCEILKNEDIDDLTPRIEVDSISIEFQSERIKVLNVHEVEDFQFADESDEDI